MWNCARDWTVRTALVSACLTVIASKDACAYIDPGTGSYVLQVIVASVLAAAFVIKSTWRNIREAVAKRFFKRSRPAE